MSQKEQDSQTPLEGNELLALIHAIEYGKPSGDRYDKFVITGDTLIVDDRTQVTTSLDFIVSFTGEKEIKLGIFYVENFPSSVRSAVMQGYLDTIFNLELVAHVDEESIPDSKPRTFDGNLPSFFFTFATSIDAEGEIKQFIVMYYLSHLNPQLIYEFSKQTFADNTIRSVLLGS